MGRAASPASSGVFDDASLALPQPHPHLLPQLLLLTKKKLAQGKGPEHPKKRKRTLRERFVANEEGMFPMLLMLRLLVLTLRLLLPMLFKNSKLQKMLLVLHQLLLKLPLVLLILLSSGSGETEARFLQQQEFQSPTAFLCGVLYCTVTVIPG